MKDTINSYAAVLLITIAGAAATWLIVHVAYANTLEVTIIGSQAEYISLQQSILNQ